MTPDWWTYVLERCDQFVASLIRQDLEVIYYLNGLVDRILDRLL